MYVCGRQGGSHITKQLEIIGIKMAKTRTRKLSEQDRSLLESLGKFSIRARHSSWDSVNHHNDIEAVGLLREISGQVTLHEYSALSDGWSKYRLHGDEGHLNHAVEIITQRVQEGVESF